MLRGVCKYPPYTLCYVFHLVLEVFTCIFGLQELNSRSGVVEDAVLELLELVLAGVEGGVEGEQVGLEFLTLEELDDPSDLDESRSGNRI